MSKIELTPIPTRNPTRLIIEKERYFWGIQPYSGAISALNEITVGRKYPEGSANYYKLSNLTATTNIELRLRSQGTTKNIQLPPEMLSRIEDYHREEPARKGLFDCASFVHYVNGLPHKFGNFNYDLWQRLPITGIERLNPGDTVMMYDFEERAGISGMMITHYAIYLTDGLFISKFGTYGELCVTNHPEMKKSFGGEDIALLKPKKI